MKEKLQELESQFVADLEKAENIQDLEAVKVQYLGKKGAVTALMKGMKDIPPAERGAFGKLINQVKASLQAQIDERREALKNLKFQEQTEKEWIDISIDPKRKEIGSLHPVTRMQYRLEDIFTAMGFQILDGPHIETEHYNFEALNVPKHHPARDMQDTFYFEDGNLLRTQTSTIQIRGMENLEAPFRIIGPGKVFRCERTDASHESCFHQLEGMLVDRDISVANLIHFMRVMLSEIFETDVEVRLRPGYFPFVEPGFELELACLLCKGKGCKVCKQVGWIELLGCGMVHPTVLRAGGIDPDEFSGFAFGMGIDRLAMMRYKINDIRYLHGGKLSFMRQFSI
ncbi:MAG: phenylalanyl-tRNA synthetase alpha chain [bacterium]|jgi:phenylalanyl-tRNA synthetase alpha chain